MTDTKFQFSPSVAPLNSISPSRFTGLQQCALQEVWAANYVPRLLPQFPSARLGSIIHKLLENAGSGDLEPHTKTTVQERWAQLVESEERKIAKITNERHFVPLSNSIRDYEVRRIRAVKKALELSASAQPKSNSASDHGEARRYGFELPFSTSDEAVKGVIDVVVKTPEGPVIQDYKSGYILEDSENGEDVLRPEYIIQMRLYAALYASATGIWPTRLEILPLRGIPHLVGFNEQICNDLLEKACDALKRVNQVIKITKSSMDLETSLAKPSQDSCRFCAYRPGCERYRNARVNILPEEKSAWPGDLWGQVTEARQLGNGDFVMIFKSGEMVRKITPDFDRHPALSNIEPGDHVGLFNLKSTNSDSVFEETKFTAIYNFS